MFDWLFNTRYEVLSRFSVKFGFEGKSSWVSCARKSGGFLLEMNVPHLKYNYYVVMCRARDWLVWLIKIATTPKSLRFQMGKLLHLNLLQELI